MQSPGLCIFYVLCVTKQLENIQKEALKQVAEPLSEAQRKLKPVARLITQTSQHLATSIHLQRHLATTLQPPCNHQPHLQHQYTFSITLQHDHTLPGLLLRRHHTLSDCRGLRVWTMPPQPMIPYHASCVGEGGMIR